jgi:serine/threonine protein phosphatase 1
MSCGVTRPSGRRCGRERRSAIRSHFDVVFVGHNPTHDEWSEPRRVLEVWNLDQGAGSGGCLTIMDAVTEEWWRSDPVRELFGQEGD